MQEVAVELFLEKGFDATTAAEIAARAGVTERTFFRHFPDKRDVLFDEADLHAQLGEAIANAPDNLGPLRVVLSAFQAIVPLFEENRPLSEPAQTVIAQTPALRERQLTKTAAVTQTMAEALRARGVDGSLAGLAAATGMAIAAHALGEWFKDPAVSLDERFQQAFAAVEAMAVPAKKVRATAGRSSS
ncbi:TetR/AcrR family transcriptional regulator [Luteibacter aegosomaticola]|uniref:TetR/AcrR family transcriptional regulator n=1 Tax=Luteibacter aegosomaticola TaxID=2911538 RepID=UPI001FFB836E|nr:TetR family transcriptional regulator [Luteibacter aegosomaticola]UPG89487.1 TetR/AcrR family transcriptional regulator [Luteibacter aegosomaticola]